MAPDSDTDLMPLKSIRSVSLSLGRLRDTLKRKREDEEEDGDSLAQSHEILDSATRLDNAIMPGEDEDGREKTAGGFTGCLGLDLGT